MAWTAIADYVVNLVWGFRRANALKNNVIVLASLRICHELGGSTEHGIRDTSFTDGNLPERRRPKINGANISGMTVVAEGEYRTSDTGTAVSWQIVDLDNADTVVASGGPYSASVNWQQITGSVTLNAADHRYELQVKGSNNHADVFAYGRIALYATA